MNITNEATSVATQTATISWNSIYAITAAIIIGVFILSTIGLAKSEILHTSAHDIRHGLAFPCH